MQISHRCWTQDQAEEYFFYNYTFWALQNLIRFCALCEQDSGLQARVQATSSPAEILVIAEQAGCPISLKQLQAAAPDLSASYWPWSGQGFRERARFFKR